ncbi:MAG: hypothetical protein C0622_00880 [Desulfuromonas sp.]|nr:MAG: hypothetical protein C0622_00880 [Desulfuromonas sp.]
MKRFRITILAICLILAWLGYSDLRVLLRNSEPLTITLADLERSGAPREWLTVTDGTQDLMQAINMSGSVTIDSFLVPLKSNLTSNKMMVWFETRDPEIIDALKTYYFLLDSDQAREEYLAKNRDLFYAKRVITGMTADNLVASANRDKLAKLLMEMEIPVTDETIFISEGKEPIRWRGFFFLGIAVIGMIKVFMSFAGSSKKETTEQP